MRRFLPGNYFSFETALLQRMAVWNMEVFFTRVPSYFPNILRILGAFSSTFFFSTFRFTAVHRQFLAAFC
jgi:hypothetical protein